MSTKMDSNQECDVAILGGGLAGLSLALHCRQEIPEARIVVLEKDRHPAPEAAFKVGESTVEVATHYFQNVLGLQEHLDNDQLPKLGLRFFFGAGDNRKIEHRLELGGSEFPPKPSYQLDRGRFENFLAERCQSMGVEFVDGAKIKSVDLGRGKQSHRVQFVRDGAETTVDARWVADCSGRAAILKRKLGLEKEITHRANAAWFRVGKEIKVDDWCDDPAWGANFDEQHSRWLSTNHLMGKGYWVWLIPLASGCTSVGIVADEDIHPLSEFNSLDKALAWLDEYEPQCGEKVREAEDKIQDFLAIRRYSRECKQVFSTRRWGITGEAGFFLDPFYSPGSDFIGYGNTFLVDLIQRDLSGKGIGFRARLYDLLYKRMHIGTAKVYQDQYPLFGDHQIMPIKILWDYLIYWTLCGHIFCHDKMLDLRSTGRHLFKIKRLDDINGFMQKFFRQWHEQKPEHWESTGEVNASEMDVVVETNRTLLESLSAKEYGEMLALNVGQMETLMWEIIDHAGINCKVPFKRKQYARARKNSFQALFEGTTRRLDSSKLAEADPANVPKTA